MNTLPETVSMKLAVLALFEKISWQSARRLTDLTETDALAKTVDPDDVRVTLADAVEEIMLCLQLPNDAEIGGAVSDLITEAYPGLNEYLIATTDR